MTLAIQSPRSASNVQPQVTADDKQTAVAAVQDPYENKDASRVIVKDQREEVLKLLGDKVTEGKTKIIWKCSTDPDLVVVDSKDDITAGDGKRHDVITGKAKLANQTTCNVFRYLNACGVPTAFRKQLDETRFLADSCDMVQYEVVVRAEAHGSYLKRNPNHKKGDVLPSYVVEFFLKTSNKNWKGTSIPKDDPFIRFTDKGAELFLPDVPIDQQTSFHTLTDYTLEGQPELFEQMSNIATHAFIHLQNAWKEQNGRLVDFKVEFGINPSGVLILADVIDNDSWRVVQDDQYVDKQVYRDGANTDTVAKLYEHVCQATGRFKANNG